MLHPRGQFAILKSKKMTSTFHFGIEYNKFYLETDLAYEENIKYMSDKEWLSLIQLGNYGNLVFLENAWVQDELSAPFNTKKSIVFRLLRNYILLSQNRIIEQGKNPQYWDLNLGCLKLEWDIDTKWETLIINGASAFKILYGLQYGLWKPSRLKN